MPKGFIKNIKIAPTKIGPEKRQEILDEIDNKGTFLPRGVSYEDMDRTFIEFVENELAIEINGKKVPVVGIVSLQRHAEFTKTWEFKDKFKNVTLPFITIVRQPDIQVGTNQAGLWNIPGRRTYTYMRVPTFNNGRKGFDLYKIPQPTSVDVNYEVRLFCGRMKDLNKLNTVIQNTFQSRQFYINVNGNPMPLLLEEVGDESPADDFENRRFYVQLFEITLSGYILSEDDYEVVPTLDRALVTSELVTDIIQPRMKVKNKADLVEYDFIFKCSTTNSISFVMNEDVKFNNMVDRKNVISYQIHVNGDLKEFPMKLNKGDNVTIQISREANKDSKFKLIGTKDD